MRIAVVTPYIATILGNRGAFVLARALAREHEVTVVSDVIDDERVAEVQALIAPARLDATSRAGVRPLRVGGMLWRQVVRGSDRRIARRLRTLHDSQRFDVIFVRSDEGHWLGEYVRSWPGASRPLVVLGILDLVDSSFLLRYERSHPGLRGLAAFAYPLLHRMEDRRLRAFDALVTNSSWTTTLLGYLYGLSALAEVDAYDDARFAGAESPTATPYIAVPTASLDRTAVLWIERLHEAGVALRPYGSKPAGRVPSAGFLADGQMVNLIGGACATLFLFDYEAFGLIPVESLALGTPVITLAKGGPYAEHRANPNVHFVRTYDEAIGMCRALIARPKTDEVVVSCRASVERYRPETGAQVLVRAFTAAKRGHSANTEFPSDFA